MRTAAILLAGALPGIALGYAALTGLILSRVKLVPIMHFPVPDPTVPSLEPVPESVAA